MTDHDLRAAERDAAAGDPAAAEVLAARRARVRLSRRGPAPALVDELKVEMDAAERRMREAESHYEIRAAILGDEVADYLAAKRGRAALRAHVVRASRIEREAGVERAAERDRHTVAWHAWARAAGFCTSNMCIRGRLEPDGTCKTCEAAGHEQCGCAGCVVPQPAPEARP